MIFKSFLLYLLLVNSFDIVRAGHIDGSVNRWSNVIPYEISSSLLSRTADIETAISIIESNTNVRLRKRIPSDIDYIFFQLGTGCSSFVGKRGGAQPVNLAFGCSIGSMMHEILHAMGGHHEHTRSDRDSFVRVNFNNILRGTEGNFRIPTSSVLVGNYDYGSIMHYPRTGFSINGQDTITPLNPNVAIGQRVTLSSGDIETFNTLYDNDSGGSVNLCTNVNCLNGGVCNPADGRCICTGGYIGNRCQTTLCEGINCQNGGVCNRFNGRCECPNGYEGSRCEVKQDRCANVNCFNGGVCRDSECFCVNGFTGNRCQFTPTLCTHLNCRNDGVCINNRCLCPNGFNGVNCEIIGCGTSDINSSSNITDTGTNTDCDNNGSSEEEERTANIVAAVTIVVCLTIMFFVLVFVGYRRYSARRIAIV